MDDQAFDINKYDFDKAEREIADKAQGSFDIRSYDFDAWDKEIAAREEVEQRSLPGDIISGLVRNVAVDFPSLFLDTAAATERIARKTLGYEQKEEVGPIGEMAKARKEEG